MISSCVASSASISPASLPPDITMIRSQIPRSSGIPEENYDNYFAAVRKIDDELIDLILCTDIDSSGRLIQKQYFRIGKKPSSKDNLLLVSTGKCTGSLSPATVSLSACASIYFMRILLSWIFHSDKILFLCLFKLEITVFSRMFRMPKIPVALLSSVRSANPFLIESCALLIADLFSVKFYRSCISWLQFQKLSPEFLYAHFRQVRQFQEFLLFLL